MTSELDSIKEQKTMKKYGDLYCSWLGKPSINNMSNFPKLIYLFSVIPFKISQWVFSTEFEMMKKKLRQRVKGKHQPKNVIKSKE